MRIAFVCQPFDPIVPPVQGGSLTLWIYQVARRCARRGHQTFVFGNQGPRLGATGTRHEDVEYIYTPTALNGVTNRAGAALARVGQGLGLGAPGVPPFAAAWSDAGFGFEVGRALKRHRCDAVLVMNYSQLVPVIRRVYPRVKIYLYMQCEWLTQLDRETMRKRIAAADLVAGCSEYITARIADRFPEFASRCVTLHNAAIPAEESGASEREPGRILFVGRVSPEKGLHVLIDAFHEVLKRFPESTLRIVGGIGSAPLEFLVGLSDEPHVRNLSRFYEPAENGKDPYFAYLERAAGPELGRRILFHGRVDHDRTAAEYRAASVVVNPSHSESFGMSLVEAMMHGVPVVATRIGGMPYIVNDQETGLVVDPDSPPAVASAICALLEDPVRAARMGEAGRRRAVERFSWDHTADTLLRQCASLLE